MQWEWPKKWQKDQKTKTKTKPSILFTNFLLLLLLSLFGFLGATPATYGGSRARSQIGAVASSLYHSSQQRQILIPLSEARDRTHTLVVPSRIRFPCTTMGIPINLFLLEI